MYNLWNSAYFLVRLKWLMQSEKIALILDLNKMWNETLTKIIRIYCCLIQMIKINQFSNLKHKFRLWILENRANGNTKISGTNNAFEKFMSMICWQVLPPKRDEWFERHISVCAVCTVNIHYLFPSSYTCSIKIVFN